MSAAARATPLTALACAIVAIGGLLILKGVYDWIGQRSDLAAQPFQRDRIVIYLAALVPFLDWGTDEEARMRAKGPLACGPAGLALLPVPLMYLLTGHRWLAGLAAAFLLVVVVVLMDRDDALGWLVYAITGLMAMGAAIYASFAD